MSYTTKIVRLLGNQDVIAKVQIRRDKDRIIYRLMDVLGLMIIPEQEEQSNLALPSPAPRQKLRIEMYPFLAVYMNSKKDIELDQFHVMFLAEPSPGIMDYYNQRTSGLILPPADNTLRNDVAEEVPAQESQVEGPAASSEE